MDLGELGRCRLCSHLRIERQRGPTHLYVSVLRSHRLKPRLACRFRIRVVQRGIPHLADLGSPGFAVETGRRGRGLVRSAVVVVVIALVS